MIPRNSPHNNMRILTPYSLSPRRIPRGCGGSGESGEEGGVGPFEVDHLLDECALPDDGAAEVDGEGVGRVVACYYALHSIPDHYHNSHPVSFRVIIRETTGEKIRTVSAAAC